ncbi:MAG: hypothetical protein ACE15F_18945 [bacterium]
MSTRNFLLYLKALIWSIFVSYTNATVCAIVNCLREGRVGDEYPEFKDTHLGESLRFIIQSFPRPEDRTLLADALEKVKSSQASMVYRNMVIEVGHYVTAVEPIGNVPSHSPGVVHCLEAGLISVVFYKPDGTLTVHRVRPFQIMPVYTLTIPDPTS